MEHRDRAFEEAFFAAQLAESSTSAATPSHGIMPFNSPTHTGPVILPAPCPAPTPCAKGARVAVSHGKHVLLPHACGEVSNAILR